MMTPPSDQAQLRATQAAFFVAGFIYAAWAPLIPFVKTRVAASDADFGLLIFCFGMGALIAMPVTGAWAAQNGARGMMRAGWVVQALALPLVVLAPGQMALGAALFLMGGGLGTLDVSMNVYGTELETRMNRPLMSGLHGSFSVGTLVGAVLSTSGLTAGLPPVGVAAVATALALLLLLWALPQLLPGSQADPEPFAWPRGVVLILSVLTGISFLTEGAMLDWGALLLIARGLAEPEAAGVGYIVFAVAMVTGRLTGDWVVARLGGYRVLLLGGIGMVLALLAIALAPGRGVVLAGFVVMGLSSANIVPVLFSLAGRQKVMPAGLAIASIATTGYAMGAMMAPAALGAVAEASSLPVAFLVLAALAAVVPLAARRVSA